MGAYVKHNEWELTKPNEGCMGVTKVDLYHFIVISSLWCKVDVTFPSLIMLLHHSFKFMLRGLLFAQMCFFSVSNVFSLHIWCSSHCHLTGGMFGQIWVHSLQCCIEHLICSSSYCIWLKPNGSFTAIMAHWIRIHRMEQLNV